MPDSRTMPDARSGEDAGQESNEVVPANYLAIMFVKGYEGFTGSRFRVRYGATTIDRLVAIKAE